MFPIERRNWLEQQVLLNEKIDIEEISKHLNVSAMTIRRDLTELEKKGKVIRTHGGAVSSKLIMSDIPHSSKKIINKNEKKMIALKALELIKENSTIILDSGTTTLELAELLKVRDDLTVITNDITIASILMDSPMKVIVMGGELQEGVGALFGPATELILKELNADILFLGAHAVHMDKGITSPTFERSIVKKRMIDAAEQTWLLADSDKFNKMAFSHVCNLIELDGIITDNRLDPNIRKTYDSTVHVKFGGEV